ncbi:4366_t:CDS:2, partial [Entrophospora sp. SA101]
GSSKDGKNNYNSFSDITYINKSASGQICSIDVSLKEIMKKTKRDNKHNAKIASSLTDFDSADRFNTNRIIGPTTPPKLNIIQMYFPLLDSFGYDNKHCYGKEVLRLW